MRTLNTPAFVLLSSAIVLILPLAAIPQVGVPMLLNFQGELRSPTTGEPVPDGEYDTVFRIYDSESGGTKLWQGTHSTANGNPVQVEDGLFSVILGSGRGNVLSASAFNKAERWLEIQVGAEILLPRQRITSVAYSIASENSRLLGEKGASEFAEDREVEAAIVAHSSVPDAHHGRYTDAEAVAAMGPKSDSNPLHHDKTTSLPWSSIASIPAGFADGIDDDSGGDITAVYTKYGLTGGGDTGAVYLSVDFGGTGTATTVAHSDHNHGTDYWSLTGNAGTDPKFNFLGTTDDNPLALVVNNARALRLTPGLSPNIIGGLSANSVTDGAIGATIGGGGVPRVLFVGPFPNRVTDSYGTVGGGADNRAGNDAGTTSDAIYATVGGGSGNAAERDFTTIAGGKDNITRGDYATVGGGTVNNSTNVATTVAGGKENTANDEYATVGGGYNNRALEYAATVGGGSSNVAGASTATVSGGSSNNVTGIGGTIPGGFNNEAREYGFAAGRRAKATHRGAFAWADSENFDFPSTAENQFSARAIGGARFVSAIDGSGNPTAGVRLLAGGGSWSSLSDKAHKESMAPADGKAVLAKLAAVPISSWNYKAQDPSIRHMGPMAQDFHAAFGLGEDDKHISTVDADGVALAAIQGLHEILREKDEKISALEARIAALEALVNKLAQSQKGGGQ